MAAQAAAAPIPRLTVILACAGDDAQAMGTVARELVAEGLRVDIVPGVDLDTRPLESAIERCSGRRSVFVLCHSAELDQYQIQLLELTVRAAEVDASRLLSVSFDPAAPECMVSSVVAALRAMGWLEQVESARHTPQRESPRGDDDRPTADPWLAQRATQPPAVPAPTPVTPSGAVRVAFAASTEGPRARKRRTLGGVLLSCAVLAVGAVSLLTAFGGDREQDGPVNTREPAHEALVAASEIDSSTAEEIGTTPTQGGHDELEISPVGSARASEAPEVETPADAPLRRPEAESGSEEPDIVHALKSREIRALDELFITYPTSSPLPYRHAHETCRDLEVVGIEGWRLPSSKELSSLANAGFLPKDTTWWVGGAGSKKRVVTWTGRSLKRKTAHGRTQAVVACLTIAGV